MLNEWGHHACESRHSRADPDTRCTSPGREKLSCEEVDYIEGDACEKFSDKIEEMWKPVWIGEKTGRQT